MRAVDSWRRGEADLAKKTGIKREIGGHKTLISLTTQFSGIVIIRRNWIQASKGNTNKIIGASAIVSFIF